MDVQDLFMRRKSQLIHLSLTCSTVYHIFLAIAYGGPPVSYYPDEFWILSTGLQLVDAGVNVIPPTVLVDRTLMPPLFEGTLYRVFGFPRFLCLLCTWIFPRQSSC